MLINKVLKIEALDCPMVLTVLFVITIKYIRNENLIRYKNNFISEINDVSRSNIIFLS